jgi:hypothetical protein
MKITPNVPTDAFSLKASATWDVLFDDNNKAVAIFSRKSRLAELAMIAPEMYELLTKIRGHIDSTCRECESKAIVPEIDALLTKIEGGRDAA